MNQKPLVSVCLVTYMHEKYIKECLLGLLNQTYENIELFILDDASEDQTYNILKSWMKKLTKRFIKVELIRNKRNCGNIPKNLNKLIKRAKGEYIRCFAGDDIMEKESIYYTVNYMEEHLDYAMIYTNAYAVNDNFKYGMKSTKYVLSQRHKAYPQKYLFKKLMQFNWIPATTVLIRSRIFKKYGLFDENIKFEDHEYWIRISRTENIGYIQKPLVYYRKADTSLTNFKSNKDGKKKIKFVFKEERKIILKYIRQLKKIERYKCLLNLYDRHYKIALEEGFFDLAVYFFINIQALKILDFFHIDIFKKK